MADIPLAVVAFFANVIDPMSDNADKGDACAPVSDSNL